MYIDFLPYHGLAMYSARFFWIRSINWYHLNIFRTKTICNEIDFHKLLLLIQILLRLHVVVQFFLWYDVSYPSSCLKAGINIKIYNTSAVRHEMIELQKQTAIILPIIKDHNVALQSFGLCCLKNAASMYRVMISGKLLLKLSIFCYS